MKINGKALEAFAAPSSFLVIDRVWRDGDRVELSLPMSLHLNAMPDDKRIAAVMYGPVVLAGRLGTQGLTPEILRAEPTKPRTVPEYKGDPVTPPDLVTGEKPVESWVARSGTKPLDFVIAGQEKPIAMSPLYRIMDERYAVYWKLSG